MIGHHPAQQQHQTTPGPPLPAGKVDEQLKDPKLRSEMEGLVNILVPSAGTVSKDDIKLLKEKVFGPSTFWITETKPTDDILEGGIVVGARSHVTSHEHCALSGA